LEVRSNAVVGGVETEIDDKHRARVALEKERRNGRVSVCLVA
jgi:hypothetical protein